jgi:hypothetical protein
MAIPDAVRALERDLRDVFGPRLESLVMYRPAVDAPGAPVPTLAMVSDLTSDDLRACAERAGGWHDAGLATPLLLATHEITRSLDVFPLEFGAILAEHAVVAGRDPFHALRVDDADVRRACEVQARSHLLHLREAYIESRGRSDRIAELMTDSAAPLAGLLKSVARLLGAPTRDEHDAAAAVERAADLPTGSLSSVLVSAVRPLSGDQAKSRFPGHLAAVERLTRFVDRWSRG